MLRQVPALASSTFNLTAGSFRQTSLIIKSLFGWAAAAGDQEELEDRIARVANIRISPAKFVGYQDQALNFSALPADFDGELVHGIKLSWVSSDDSRLRIDEAGRATFLRPGLARITCQAGAVQADAYVLIKPGGRPEQTDEQWLLDQAGLTATGEVTTSTGTSAGLWPRLLDHLAPTASAQGGSATADKPHDELWSESCNLVGSPRNRAIEATRMGTVLPEGSNFNFAVPVVSTGGRGIAAALTLYYNSRVWSRSLNTVTFDALRGWPFTGFTLGFGRIVTYDGKFILIDPDGTRRKLNLVTGSTYKTADGTHTTFVGTAAAGGTVYFNDGTTMTVGAVNNRLLPTQITEANGNFILIAYKSSAAGYHPLALDYVTDTLGRIIEFKYNGSNELTSVTVPAAAGMPPTRVQFGYEDKRLNYTFSGVSADNAPLNQNLRTLRQIYFSTMQTGYLLTYSPYGMAYEFSLRRQMSTTGSTINNGIESAQTKLNYPTLGSTVQTDAPGFNQLSETPGGNYNYSKSEDLVAQTMTFTTSRPDGSTSLLTRSTNSSSVANGLLTQAEIKSGSTSLAKSTLTYANDAGGSPQVQSATSFDDAGTPTKVDFSYDQYGNVTDKRDYGFQISGAWQVRRRTRLTYKTDTAYVNAYLRDLVTQVEVLDALQNTTDTDDVVLAKTSFTYDDYAAMGGMENYGGAAAPPGHLSSYNTSLTVRGNVTGTTEWTNIAANTSITRTARIDIFGNTVRAQVSCCNQKRFTFTSATYWSQPVEVINGDPAGVHLKTTFVYNFDTGLVTSSSDPNGLATGFSYDSTQRPTQATYSTGATSVMSYDDLNLSASRTVNYVEGGASKSVTASVVYDGWGGMKQSTSSNDGQVNIGYDTIGRVSTRTNPFPVGATPGPASTYQYDGLGRVKQVTLPNSNTIKYDYSGATATVTDQVNRKTKQQADGLGRLVKVTEQDAAGALAQDTNYTYDLLDRLTLIDQGGQTRSFKYDALGRQLFEKIPEHSAPINDGTGVMWSSKSTYTDFHAVATREDARRVVTTYGYDVLNRMTSVSYNTSNAPGVATTAGVTFAYDTSSSSSTKGLLQSVTVGTGYQESYGYDSNNRVSTVTRTIDSRTYQTGYLYTTASQLTRLTYPSSRVVNMNHDSKGRMSSLTDGSSANYLSGVGYNEAGQVTGWSLGNGVAEGFGYDSQTLQLTSQSATRSGSTLLSLTYGYQALAGQNGAGTNSGNSGQLISVSGTINGTTESASYTYDLWRRLATSSQTTNGASAQRRFGYDRFGNRTSMHNAVSGGTQIQAISYQLTGGVANNRIQSLSNVGSTVTYSYDAAGNVTFDGAHNFSYDGENRQVSVDGGTTASYGYDHLNKRVKKTVSGTTTHYVWEGNQVISEHNASTGAATVEYVYAGGRMVAKEAGGVRRYLLSDRLSERVILDNSGNVVGRQGHLPFGEELGVSGETEKHRLTSYERDSESGQDYAVNRYHSSNAGRFNSADKARGNIFNPPSLNKYTYVDNDPINFNDPSGLARVVNGFWVGEGDLEFDPQTGLFWHEGTQSWGDLFNSAGVGVNVHGDVTQNLNEASNYFDSNLSALLQEIDALNASSQAPVVAGFIGPLKPNSGKVDCNKLRQKIDKLAEELQERAEDLRNDPHDLIPGGYLSESNPHPKYGSIQGHQRQFFEKRRALNDRIKIFDNNCGGEPPVPPALRDLGQLPLPSRTRPLPSSPSGGVNPSVAIPIVVGGAVLITCILCPECCVAVSPILAVP